MSADLPLYLVDADTERFALGAVLTSGEDAWRRVAPYLTEDDFAIRKHMLIWRAMAQLAGEGEPIDRVTLYNRIERNRDLQEVGGMTTLVDLDTGMPAMQHPEAYAKAVRFKSQERQIWGVFGNISIQAGLGMEKPGELLQQARQAIEQIHLLDLSFGPEKASDFDVSRLLAVNRATVNYSFSSVQNITGGMRPGEVTLLASRPSMGKSAFALNVGLEAARDGKCVGIFSREMSKDELRRRLIANLAQINLFDLMRGEITPVERLEAEDAKRELEGIALFLDDRSKTVAEIRRQAEVSRYDLVIIDYLGLLLPPGRHENRNAEVSAISREVKLMAQELAIPVVALHQLSREVEKRADKRPMMSDLRDSGSLEQDADLVTFLYREGYYNREKPELEHSAEFIVAKQRNGPTGCVPLEFHGSFATFADATEAATGASV
jgi:replicative DNA helicase